MIAKTIAVLCVLALPVSLSFWHKSHKHPAQHRYDLTVYKSVWVYLKDGVCGLHMISMPTKVASRTEFHATLPNAGLLQGRSFYLSSEVQGPYRITWIIFPLWFPTAILAGSCGAALFVGPVRRWVRVRTGRCVECGYSLRGNRSGRCPECGPPCPSDHSGHRSSTKMPGRNPSASRQRYRL